MRFKLKKNMNYLENHSRKMYIVLSIAMKIKNKISGTPCQCVFPTTYNPLTFKVRVNRPLLGALVPSGEIKVNSRSIQKIKLKPQNININLLTY